MRRDRLATAPLSVARLRDMGVALGAGVVHLPPAEHCPVRCTAEIIGVLAAESAGRCGPCRFGLPALGAAVARLAAGRADPSEVERLAALVTGRGACAHPDGTVRLVRSLLDVARDEVQNHAAGRCSYGALATPPVRELAGRREAS